MGTSGLSSLLVEEGLLNEIDSQTIKKTCGSGGCAFAKGVLALGLVDEDELAAFLAERTAYKVASRTLLDDTSPAALAAVDAPLIERLEVLPLELKGGTLTVAMADPLDLDTIKQLEFFTGYKVKPIIATMSQLYKALKRILKNFDPQNSAIENFLSNHALAASKRLQVVEGIAEVADLPPPSQKPAPAKQATVSSFGDLGMDDDEESMDLDSDDGMDLSGDSASLQVGMGDESESLDDIDDIEAFDSGELEDTTLAQDLGQAEALTAGDDDLLGSDSSSDDRNSGEMSLDEALDELDWEDDDNAPSPPPKAPALNKPAVAKAAVAKAAAVKEQVMAEDPSAYGLPDLEGLEGELDEAMASETESTESSGRESLGMDADLADFGIDTASLEEASLEEASDKLPDLPAAESELEDEEADAFAAAAANGGLNFSDELSFNSESGDELGDEMADDFLGDDPEAEAAHAVEEAHSISDDDLLADLGEAADFDLAGELAASPETMESHPDTEPFENIPPPPRTISKTKAQVALNKALIKVQLGTEGDAREKIEELCDFVEFHQMLIWQRADSSTPWQLLSLYPDHSSAADSPMDMASAPNDDSGWQTQTEAPATHIFQKILTVSDGEYCVELRSSHQQGTEILAPMEQLLRSWFAKF